MPAALPIMLTLTTNAPEDTELVGELLGSLAGAGDVLALEGELGAGKTRLVRGLARGLGLDADLVHSPTFVLMNEYRPGAGSGPGGLRLVHVDAYRLGGDEELDTIGWDEALAGGAVVAVEWPSRIAGAIKRLGPAVAAVQLHHAGDEERRRLVVHLPAGWQRRPGFAKVMSALGRFGSGGGVVVGGERCRGCGRELPAGAPHAPFCGTRCRDADLGRWFSEAYRVSRPVEADDELSE